MDDQKIRKLEDASRAAVSCMENVMRDRQAMKRDFAASTGR